MMASRDINELHPKVKVLCNLFIDKCKSEGIDVIITETYRSIADQNELYAIGRTKKGRIVTNAKGGQSFHNYRLAFDFAPLKNKKIDWNDLDLFKKCGAIAESVGLEYSGNWEKFTEYCHCQYSGGLTLSDLQNGKTIC